MYPEIPFPTLPYNNLYFNVHYYARLDVTNVNHKRPTVIHSYVPFSNASNGVIEIDTILHPIRIQSVPLFLYHLPHGALQFLHDVQ